MRFGQKKNYVAKDFCEIVYTNHSKSNTDRMKANFVGKNNFYIPLVLGIPLLWDRTWCTKGFAIDDDTKTTTKKKEFHSCFAFCAIFPTKKSPMYTLCSTKQSINICIWAARSSRWLPIFPVLSKNLFVYFSCTQRDWFIYINTCTMYMYELRIVW